MVLFTKNIVVNICFFHLLLISSAFTQQKSISKETLETFYAAAESNDISTMQTIFEPYKNHPKATKFFVYERDDLNLLHKAAEKGSITIFEYIFSLITEESVDLLLNNRDINPKVNPLILAIKYNHYDLVKYLVEKKANPYAYAEKSEITPGALIEPGHSMINSIQYATEQNLSDILKVLNTISANSFEAEPAPAWAYALTLLGFVIPLTIPFIFCDNKLSPDMVGFIVYFSYLTEAATGLDLVTFSLEKSHKERYKLIQLKNSLERNRSKAFLTSYGKDTLKQPHKHVTLLASIISGSLIAGYITYKNKN